jgi:hypothetical protein
LIYLGPRLRREKRSQTMPLQKNGSIQRQLRNTMVRLLCIVMCAIGQQSQPQPLPRPSKQQSTTLDMAPFLWCLSPMANCRSTSDSTLNSQPATTTSSSSLTSTGSSDLTGRVTVCLPLRNLRRVRMHQRQLRATTATVLHSNRSACLKTAPTDSRRCTSTYRGT